MSSRDSDSGGYERIDSGILEGVTDLDTGRDAEADRDASKEPSASNGTGSKEGDGARGDRSQPTISVPPPIPTEAVREPGATLRSSEDQSDLSQELESGAGEVLGAFAPFYEQAEESEHIRLSDLDDISLRIDPEKLPSLAPLPLPAPEKKSPLLIRGGIVLGITAVGVIAWALGFRGSRPVEPVPLDSRPPQGVEAAQAVPPEQKPAGEQSPPALEPERETSFEFSLDEAAPQEQRRDSAGKADEDRASRRASGSEDEKGSGNGNGEAAEKKAGEKVVAEKEPAVVPERTPYDEEESGAEVSAAASGPDEKASGEAVAASSVAEPAPVGETAAAVPGTEQAAAKTADREPTIEKETLDRNEVAEGLDKMKDSVRACVGGKHGIAKVEVTISGSGRVRKAVVTGVFAGTPEGSCIARTVRAARFPKFSGDPVTVEYPFVL